MYHTDITDNNSRIPLTINNAFDAIEIIACGDIFYISLFFKEQTERERERTGEREKAKEREGEEKRKKDIESD